MTGCLLRLRCVKLGNDHASGLELIVLQCFFVVYDVLFALSSKYGAGSQASDPRILSIVSHFESLTFSNGDEHLERLVM